jgi:hypothetical protein
MLELRDARHLIDEAERAASAGDLASVDELLRAVARIQAAELGPLHPDLAETLNNLAIVAEKMGRSGDAEKFYRRAAAIASASLPAGHPMVAASQQNLEDFCFASGLPLDAPAAMTLSAQDSELGLDAFAREDAAAASEAAPAPADAQTADPRTADPRPADPPTADALPADDDLTLRATPPRSSRPWAASNAPTATASEPSPPAPPRTSHTLAWAALAVAVVAGAAMLVMQPWESRESAPPPAVDQSAVPPAAERPVVQTPSDPARSPQAASPAAAIDKPPAPASASGSITLAVAQLCATLSTSGGSWRCNPAGDSVAAGRLVLYTRVRSPRDTAIEHRWYRGDTLQKTVKLTTRASPTEGYRTYSRNTVDNAGDWRVEVRSADGDLLHEQHFTVH